MTEYEKQKIYEMRLDGSGYKAIGVVLGLSRDSVRSYCKRIGLDGDSKVIAINISEQKTKNLICMNCNKPIKQKKKGTARKFCSDKCRRTWWKSHPENVKKNETAMYKITCEYCGREFESYGNKKRKFCNHDCFVKHRFYEREGN